jgi:hypothetical protein
MATLPALPRESWMVLAAAGALVALGQTARLWWHGAALRWRLKSQLVRAAAGEARAEKLLVRAGYRIEARQQITRWAVSVDGQARQMTLRADFVVSRRRRRWVAEVKTGEEAVDIAAVATRRQLLEYRCAFEVDGVLLVDAEAGQVHAVEFALPAAAAPSALRSMAVAFFAGALAGAALLAYLIGGQR